MTGTGHGGWIEVGRVGGAYGVRGWLRLASYTHEPEALIQYRPWRFQSAGRSMEPTILEVRTHGRGFVVRIAECAAREDAEAWRGAAVEVPVAVLPPLPAGEYYWGQLVGLTVETVEGRSLGTVDHLLETGANDVLVVRGERERLLPYVPDVVRSVDLAGGRMVVEWDPDF